mmetsp:Transcript_4176/g.18764  ORF Transcript_4176/g.18764 Transcript_4176/m.18764 type:complete len:240 (-) Transcript_4176:182-901(-)
MSASSEVSDIDPATSASCILSAPGDAIGGLGFRALRVTLGVDPYMPSRSARSGFGSGTSRLGCSVLDAALDAALDSAARRPSILFTSASCASSSANLLRLLAFSIRSVSSENPSSAADAVSVLAACAGPLADTRGGASVGARSGSTSPFATSLPSHSPQYNVDDVARLSFPLCTARSSLGRLDRLPVPFLAMCAHVVTLSSRSALASAAGSLVDVARSARVDAPGPSVRGGVSRSASSS